VKDRLIYGDKGKFGATQVHTLCGLEKCPPVFLDKATWDAKRIGMICLANDDLADMQAIIDKLCVNYKKCDYEKVETLRRAVAYILWTQRRSGVFVSPFAMSTFTNGLFE